jgi:hypothetical protein
LLTLAIKLIAISQLPMAVTLLAAWSGMEGVAAILFSFAKVFNLLQFVGEIILLAIGMGRREKKPATPNASPPQSKMRFSVRH